MQLKSKLSRTSVEKLVRTSAAAASSTREIRRRQRSSASTASNSLFPTAVMTAFLLLIGAIDCRNSKPCGHLHEDGPVLEDGRLAARTDHECAFVLFEDGRSAHHRTRRQCIAVIDRSLDETAGFVEIDRPMALERGLARIAGAKLEGPFGSRHRRRERKPQRDELNRAAGR